MLQEAPDEVSSRQANDRLPARFRIATHPKHHIGPIYPDDPLVRNRHSMGVAAKIVEYRLRATQRLFGIDHPIVGEEALPESLPRSLGGMTFRKTMLDSQTLQTSDELTAKHLG